MLCSSSTKQIVNLFFIFLLFYRVDFDFLRSVFYSILCCSPYHKPQYTHLVTAVTPTIVGQQFLRHINLIFDTEDRRWTLYSSKILEAILSCITSSSSQHENTFDCVEMLKERKIDWCLTHRPLNYSRGSKRMACILCKTTEWKDLCREEHC